MAHDGAAPGGKKPKEEHTREETFMSNLSQPFDAGRFPGGGEVRPDGKAAVMTLRGPENGSLRLFSLWEGVILSFNRIDTQVWPLAQAEANNILLV